MAKILILGAGSMGTAFSFPCSDNNHQVSVVGTHLENDFIDQINSVKKHPILNCDIPKNVKFFKIEKLFANTLAMAVVAWHGPITGVSPEISRSSLSATS